MLWSDAPPEPRSRRANWATLLFSWWCTAFAVVIILTRLAGRKIRTGRLFREDNIMALSLIPLLIRMGLVHVILLYGTNNVQAEGLSAQSIYQRSIGSRLVLASRIFYALFIWVSKFTVSEFLKRLTTAIWRRSYELCLQLIRIFLVVTFIGVVIATLSECQPFDHYWQVVPEPGPHCRQGYAQLLTMGTADIITDILLVIFPIPIVLRSHMPLKRKISLVFLFSMSVLLIVITAFRMPNVISHRGRQQYRTVWASCEILASAAVSNAVILGSFVRDRGVKRNKYRKGSAIDSIERASTRRATIETLHRDSDEILFREMGCRMPDDLTSPVSRIPRPAPAAIVTSPFTEPVYHNNAGILTSVHSNTDGPPSPHDSADTLRKQSSIPSSPGTSRSVSFFDVGGLLNSNNTSNPRTSSRGTISHDFAVQAPPPASTNRSPRGGGGGGGGIFSDIGARLTPTTSRPRSLQRRVSGRDDQARNTSTARTRDERSRSRRQPLQSTPESQGGAMDLQDAGGLLSP